MNSPYKWPASNAEYFFHLMTLSWVFAILRLLYTVFAGFFFHLLCTPNFPMHVRCGNYIVMYGPCGNKTWSWYSHWWHNGLWVDYSTVGMCGYLNQCIISYSLLSYDFSTIKYRSFHWNLCQIENLFAQEKNTFRSGLQNVGHFVLINMS